jgi:hypothetical protein
MAPVPRHGAEGDPRGEPLGGRGMPQGRGADVACAETGAWWGCAQSALDTAAGHGGGGAGPGCVRAARGGQEPGGGAVGLPGGAPQVEGVSRPRAGAVLGARTPGPVAQVARALARAPVQGERCVAAPSTAREGGAGDARVHRRPRREESVALWEAAHGWEPLCGLGAQACQGLPGACEDLWGEAAPGAGTEAQSAGREALVMFARQDVVLQWWCGAESRGCAGARRQEPHRTDRGLWRACALATALQSGDHVLAS